MNLKDQLRSKVDAYNSYEELKKTDRYKFETRYYSLISELQDYASQGFTEHTFMFMAEYKNMIEEIIKKLSEDGIECVVMENTDKMCKVKVKW